MKTRHKILDKIDKIEKLDKIANWTKLKKMD